MRKALLSYAYTAWYLVHLLLSSEVVPQFYRNRENICRKDPLKYSVQLQHMPAYKEDNSVYVQTPIPACRYRSHRKIQE